MDALTNSDGIDNLVATGYPVGDLPIVASAVEPPLSADVSVSDELAAASDSNQDSRTARGDSLALGVVVMLSLTVVQRLVSMTRSVLFCGFLQDDQLGRWSLSLSFLAMAAPLALCA